MNVLASSVGRRKEAVATLKIVKGTGKFFINNKNASDYLQNNSNNLMLINGPLDLLQKLSIEEISSTNLKFPLLTNVLENELNSSPKNSQKFENTWDSSEKLMQFEHSSGLETSHPFSYSKAAGVDVSRKAEDPKNFPTYPQAKLGVADARLEDAKLKMGKEKEIFEREQNFHVKTFALEKENTNRVHGQNSNNNQSINIPNFDIFVKVQGGGFVGQAEAIKLAVARAIYVLTSHSSTQEIIKKNLKDKGYLTQDARVKERRKYGLKKARKAPQYNKR